MAGSSIIGSLRINLGIDSANFDKGLKQSHGKLAAFGKVAKSGALAIASAVTATGIGLGVGIKSAINAADDMAKAAQKVGVPIEELSRLKHAADLSGLSFEQLQTGVGRLSANMRDAAMGVGEGAQAFEDLGVAVTDVDGNLRTSSDVMRDLADRFATMPDDAQKSALAMELMGKSGRDMIPLLNQGSAALGELMAEADSFGQVFTAEMGSQAETFNDNISRLQGSFAALAADVTERVLPYLVQFSDWMVQNGPQIATVVGHIVDFGVEVAKANAAVIGFVVDAGTKIADFAADVGRIFRELPEQLRQIGRDMISGLMGGLTEKFENLKSTAANIGRGIIDTFDRIFDRHSPSRIMADLGADIVRGLSLGIERQEGDVQRGVEGFARNIADTFSGVLTGAVEFKDALRGILADSLGSAGSGLINAGIGSLFSAIKIPGYANGTNFHPGGLAWVGERGRELVNMPRGSQVIPNREIGGGGNVFNFSPQIDARGADSAAVARAMAEQRTQFEAFKESFRDDVIATVNDPRHRGRI